MNERMPIGSNREPPQATALVPVGDNLPTVRGSYGLSDYPLGFPDTAGQRDFGQLLEYWHIFNKRKWLILAVVAAFVAIGAVRTWMQTPLYTATVKVQIDPSGTRVLDSGSTAPIDHDTYTFMSTQYKLLESRTMAERVAAAVALGNDEDFFKSRSSSPLALVFNLFKSGSSGGQTRDAAQLDRRAAGIVLANREVRPVKGSRLVGIAYSDPDPKRAQIIANAFADAYTASNIDKRFQANESAKIFLEDKIQQLKTKLEDAEQKMLAFAEDQKIVQVNDETSMAETNLAAAHAELGNLISERTKNEQLWRQTDASGNIDLPQFLSNEVIEGLRSKRKDLELEYEQKLQTYKPNFPTMLQIKSQIEKIDSQLDSEVSAIRSSLKGGYEASLSREKELKQRIETLTTGVLDLQKRSVQYNILKREAETTRELYTSLLQRFKEVDVASGVGANNVFVVDRASVPGAPSSPNLMRALMIAVGLGLVFGCGAAYGLEKLDDKVQTPEQVELITGLSTLGVIPKSRNVEMEVGDPRSALAEAYRSLCTSLQFATDHGLPRSLAITSSGPTEGKSLTAISIASHFASLGKKVLLVDGDLRKPSLHEKLGTDNAEGFSNYLTGACAPPEVLRQTSIANLAFMPSGPLPPNAVDLLGSPRLHSLLSVGAEIFDLIIIDGPPVLGLADAQLLSNATDGTIFIAAAGVSKTGHIRGALRRLQLSRGLVVGTVLTSYEARAAGYGQSYGYGYGYGYGASTDLEPDQVAALGHLK